MSTVDVVQQSLMNRMLRGELAPGTWLRQDAVAANEGVSKIPVREAFQRLVGLGLLRFEPNRGAVIPTLSSEEAEENYALRRAVEPLLLRQAIPAMSVVDLAEAELALTAEGPATEANWHFHRSLYQAANWDRGLAVTRILNIAVAPYVLLYTERLGGASNSDAEHDALLNACRQGNVDDAVDILVDHLDHAAAALLSYLADEEADR